MNIPYQPNSLYMNQSNVMGMPMHVSANMPFVSSQPMLFIDNDLNQFYKNELKNLMFNNMEIEKWYNEIIKINQIEQGNREEILDVFALNSIVNNDKCKLFYNWLLLRTNNEIRVFNAFNYNNQQTNIRISDLDLSDKNKRFFILTGLLIIFDIFKNKNKETAEKFYYDYTDKTLTNTIECIDNIKKQNIDISNDETFQTNVKSLISLLNECYINNESNKKTGFFSGGTKGKYKNKNKTNKKNKKKKIKTKKNIKRTKNSCKRLHRNKSNKKYRK